MENDVGFYASRDIIDLDRQGGHYMLHVQAMTAEGLHSKSDIAAELAHRDALIESERAKVAVLVEAMEEIHDQCLIGAENGVKLDSYILGLTTEALRKAKE